MDGEVKLLDFGIAARITERAAIAGTLAYMAPEILAHQAPSPASDLYSLGILLFQMLAERFPFSADSITRMYQQIMGEPDAHTLSMTVAKFLEGYRSSQQQASDELKGSSGEITLANVDDAQTDPETRLREKFSVDALELPGIDPEVQRIVFKLLERDPSERYQSADQVLRELAAAVSFPLPTETAATRESFLQAAILVGRDEELALLSEGLSGANARRGGAFLIGGESGIGKSRLLAELRTQARVAGFWVAEGQCSREGGSHYQEWLPLLRALCFRVEPTDAEAGVLREVVPELASLLERSIPSVRPLHPDAALERLTGTLNGMLARLDKPLLLLMEDLHWGRSESLTLLARMVPQLGSLPVLIVGSYRSDESAALPDMLPGMQPIPLVRLQNEDIGRLSASMLGAVGEQPELVDYLTRHTEGNVFFLIEIVRALAEDAGAIQLIRTGQLPERLLTAGIERIADWRVDRVPAEFRPVLELAATYGRSLNLQILEQAFPTVPLRDFLFAAADAAVLERQVHVWRFTHDKLRESILRRMSAPERQALHRQVAELLTALPKGAEHEDQSSLIASHFEQAALWEQALTHYLAASDYTTRLSLYGEARLYLQSAERMLASLPDDDFRRSSQVELLLRQIQTSLLTDKIEVQLERADRARELLSGGAHANAPARQHKLRLARIDYLLGRAYDYAGQPLAAIGCYQRVLPIAQDFGDEELLVLPAYVIGAARAIQGEVTQAAQLLSQAIGPILRIGAPFEQLRCMLYYSMALSACGRYREAIPYIERARSEGARLGQPSIVAMISALQGGMNRILADWPACLEAGQSAVRVAREVGDKVFLFLGLSLSAWSHAHLTQLEPAHTELAEAHELIKQTGGRLMGADWIEGGGGELALLSNENPQALAIAQALRDKSRAAGLILSQGIAERIWAAALGRMGAAREEFDPHFTDSEQLFERSGNVLDRAQTTLWRGRIYRERGLEQEAQPHLMAALKVFEELSTPAAFAEALRFAKE